MQHSRPTIRALAWVAGLYVLPTLAPAADVVIEVFDRDGAPVPEVAVYALVVDDTHSARATGDGQAAAPSHPQAEISQNELAFEPHLSIVETGTSIRFPNNDDVRHHVYSFSDAKRFDLTIDSGSAVSETFDTAGLVTLGCNIHDGMLAFVLVVDTPHFATTGRDGTASLPALPAGRYDIHVWTPRLPEKAMPEPARLEVDENGSYRPSFMFEKKLYPPHEHSETSLHWSHY